MGQSFVAPNPDYAKAVREAVMGFPVARYVGFELGALAPGRAELVLPYREELSQGGGVVQAGIVGMIADVAGGSAAGTLLPPGHILVTCDYTVKLLTPAVGERLIARGEVIKPGASLTVSRGDVFVLQGERERLCATALVTTMAVKLG